tara:strand:+ start:1033 stop:1380 length:348 start_codon:yes stop_codon:yes gene_type:complete
MPQAEIIEEKPITMVETKEKLSSLEKKQKELNFRATKTHEYLKKFAKTDFKKSQELYKKIQDLDIPRLKDRQIVKIVDLLPGNVSDLKIIFSGETITITSENLQKIVDVMKEYVK